MNKKRLELREWLNMFWGQYDKSCNFKPEKRAKKAYKELRKLVESLGT